MSVRTVIFVCTGDVNCKSITSRELMRILYLFRESAVFRTNNRIYAFVMSLILERSMNVRYSIKPNYITISIYRGSFKEFNSYSIHVSIKI